MFIEKLKQFDVLDKRLFVNDVEIKLLQKLVNSTDGTDFYVCRTYVPEFVFENDWEYILATDDMDEDESNKTWRGRVTHTILDKKTRHPLIYHYFVDNKMGLYYKGKRASKNPVEEF